MISKNKIIFIFIIFIFITLASIPINALINKITIESPTYGDIFVRGQTIKITGVIMSTTSYPNQLKIELYKGGDLRNNGNLIYNTTTNVVLKLDTFSSMIFSCNINLPTNLTCGNDYRIKASNPNDLTINSISAYFWITDYDFIIKNPKINSDFLPGEDILIEWLYTKDPTSNSIFPNIDILLNNIDNNEKITILENIPSNQLSCNAKIPIDIISGNNYKIEIINHEISSEENENYKPWKISELFSIHNVEDFLNSKLIINSPNNSINLLPSDKYNIQWSINNDLSSDLIPEFIDIKLFNKDNSNLVTISESIRSDKLNHNWIVQNDLITGNNYYIVLYKHNEKKIVGGSQNFSIFNPSHQSSFPLKILSPDEKTILLQEDNIDIIWEINNDLSDDVSDTINIVLYDQNRKKDIIIAQDVISDSLIYSWTIPSDIASSTKYYIKFFDSDDNDLKGCSKEFYIFNTARLWDLDKDEGNIYYMGNNVGIGTVNPEFKLSVEGDINFTGSLYNDGQQFMTYKDGNVGVGTENPTEKLSVNGTIRAKKIIVNSDWSDFVFKNKYKLLSLEEVENYIKENGHLPDIPSENEVLKNGISLGEIDSKLLQKIEEIILYLIELKKENIELKEKIDNLKE